MVVERLGVLAKSMPREVVDCLTIMLEGEGEVWAQADEIRETLTALKQQGDQAAWDRAVLLINRLGERGQLQYRDLLE